MNILYRWNTLGLLVVACFTINYADQEYFSLNTSSNTHTTAANVSTGAKVRVFSKGLVIVGSANSVDGTNSYPEETLFLHAAKGEQ